MDALMNMLVGFMVVMVMFSVGFDEECYVSKVSIFDVGGISVILRLRVNPFCRVVKKQFSPFSPVNSAVHLV